MPKAIFIIACQSGTEDKDTGLISLFNVIEKIEATILKPPPGGFKGTILVQSMPLRVIASWMKSDDDDPNQEFEFHITGLMPSDRKVGFEATGTFKFAEGRSVHRLTVNVQGQLPITESGIMWIENRIRKTGTDEWLSQSYPIVVSATEITPTEASDKKTPQAS